MEMNNTISLLAHSPLLGTTRDHLERGLRVILHHPYAIYYRVTEQEITIVRVLHSARDIISIAEHGGIIH